ncbi:unnamed protein product [Penicillium salamii]|uniref:Uncharacterized protein n=1 Tax=Penicillium salamii TaxID=1612424 RepID=A0A9W4IXM8_9EURO|nr:unnamed protein product [Penicillium salamii]
MTFTSPPWEQRGRILQRWIEGRQSGCPYPKSVFTLTYKSRDYLIVAKREKLNAKLLASLQIENINSTYHNISVTQRNVSAPTWWIGRTAPGMVIVDDIFRSKRNDDSYISEFTKAVYQLEFPLNTLKSVVVANINEKDTVHCARHQVYKSLRLQYPSQTQHIWNSSSHEFQALLGTGSRWGLCSVCLGSRQKAYFQDSDFQH